MSLQVKRAGLRWVQALLAVTTLVCLCAAGLCVSHSVVLDDTSAAMTTGAAENLVTFYKSHELTPERCRSLLARAENRVDVDRQIKDILASERDVHIWLCSAFLMAGISCGWSWRSFSGSGYATGASQGHALRTSGEDLAKRAGD